MNPVDFPLSNGTLMGGPAKKYGTAEDVGDLPVCRFDQGIVSCWRPTWAERLSILFCGPISTKSASRRTR